MIQNYWFYELKEDELADGIEVTNFLIEKVILTEEKLEVGD